jgi:hypothetical protein
MTTTIPLFEYLSAVREHVCSRCIERPPGGPPCAALGKRCGVELHLDSIVDMVHGSRAAQIDPYIDRLHTSVCANCAVRPTNQCPCPLDYLLLLTVEAIESVDAEHAERAAELLLV